MYTFRQAGGLHNLKESAWEIAIADWFSNHYGTFSSFSSLEREFESHMLLFASHVDCKGLCIGVSLRVNDFVVPVHRINEHELNRVLIFIGQEGKLDNALPALLRLKAIVFALGGGQSPPFLGL